MAVYEITTESGVVYQVTTADSYPRIPRQTPLTAIGRSVGAAMGGVPGEALGGYLGAHPKQILNKAPMLGMIGGGLAAGIPGAGIGGAGGEAFRQAGSSLLKMPVPNTTLKQVASIGKEGALGAASELGGGLIAKGVSSAVKKATPVVGSIVDSLGGLIKGTGNIAIQHPEITRSGYATPQKVKSFIKDISQSLQSYKKKSGEIYDVHLHSNYASKPKVGRSQVLRSIERLKDGLAVSDDFSLKRSGPAGAVNKAGDVLLPQKQVTQDVMGVPYEELSEASGVAAQADTVSAKQFGPDDAISMVNNLRNKFEKMALHTTAYGEKVQGRLNAKDLVNLRKTADEYIEYGKDVPDHVQSILKKFRSEIDGIIQAKYPKFKAADRQYETMRKTVSTIKEEFKIPEQKPFSKMTDREIMVAQENMARTLNPQSTMKAAILEAEKRMGTKGKIFTEARKLGAASGSGQRHSQFEPVLRPGFGYAMLAGGAGSAAGAALSGNPLALVPTAAAGLSGVLTSPRALGSLIRAGGKISQGVRSVGNPTQKAAIREILKILTERSRKKQ